MRRFQRGDTEAVVALWTECFPGDPARNEPRGVISRKLDRDPDLFWVAVGSADARAGSAGDEAESRVGSGQARVVGAVLAGYDGYRGWLYHLAVAPGARRHGVARALVEHAVGELHALGCRKVNLQVRETNAEVIAMYASLGWSEDRSVSLGRVLPEAWGEPG